MELYDTATLLSVISVQKPPLGYWLDTFFPSVITFDTQEIIFDMIAPSRRLAPFVAPNVRGRIMRREGTTAKSFRPAYVKPKHSVDPSQTIARMAGEAIGGSLSREERYNAIVAENMRMEKEMITRRLDWMAARAIIDGQVTVEGDDYPTQTVMFGRDSGLTVDLTGAAWADGSGSPFVSDHNPLIDIRTARRLSWEKANAPIDRLTFGLDAWDAFSNNTFIRPLLSNQMRGSLTDFNTAVPDGMPIEYMGRLQGGQGQGGLDMYVYSDVYENNDGTNEDFMDPWMVVGTGPALQGVRCFGAIEDFDAGLRAIDMFPNMDREKDPSQAYTWTSCAPLMVPAQPNACFRLTVGS